MVLEKTLSHWRDEKTEVQRSQTTWLKFIQLISHRARTQVHSNYNNTNNTRTGYKNLKIFLGSLECVTLTLLDLTATPNPEFILFSPLAWSNMARQWGKVFRESRTTWGTPKVITPKLTSQPKMGEGQEETIHKIRNPNGWLVWGEKISTN